MNGFRPVPVWSRWQRIIHWVNAFAVLLLLPLGAFILLGDFLGVPEEGEGRIITAHAVIGFVFAAGALARIIYLFIGPPSSRWRDVVPHTRAQFDLLIATVKYYLSGFKGKAPLYFSHNPIAGFADTVLFTFFVTQAATGVTMFLLHGGEEHARGNVHGLEAATQAAEPFPEWVLVLHLVGAIVIALFVIAHFTALGIHDVMERRGLTSSMISGSKFFDEKEVDELRDQVKMKSPQPPPGT